MKRTNEREREREPNVFALWKFERNDVDDESFEELTRSTASHIVFELNSESRSPCDIQHSIVCNRNDASGSSDKFNITAGAIKIVEAEVEVADDNDGDDGDDNVNDWFEWAIRSLILQYAKSNLFTIISISARWSDILTTRGMILFFATLVIVSAATTTKCDIFGGWRLSMQQSMPNVDLNAMYDVNLLKPNRFLLR